MKKNTIHWIVALAAVLIAYNIAIFAIPFPKTAVFFLSWGFTMVALGLQIYIIQTAFGKNRDTKSKFYGFPIVKVGVIYLVVQLILGLIFIILSAAVAVPTWLPLVLYVVLLSAAALGFVAADSTRDELERQDAVLKRKVMFMRSLQSKATSLVSLAGDEELKHLLEQFSEELRFSDPVSNEGLRNVETDLDACVDELQRAVVDGDRESALELERKARTILTERNRLCKLGK